MQKRSPFVLFVLCVLFSHLAPAADSVAPATATYTSKRGEPSITVNAGTIYRSTPLLFTNCVLYADTAGVSTQGLAGVTVSLAVGTTTTNTTTCVTNSAIVTSAPNGRWACTITVPSAPTFSVEVKITDTNGSAYIYPPKLFNTASSLFR